MKKEFQKSKSLKTKVTFSSQNFDFCACPSHNAQKRNAGGKEGKLLCCKPIFDRIKGNLAKMQPKNHQHVQKNPLFAKSSRSQWVISCMINQSLFICTHIHSCFKQKVMKFKEIINTKIGVLASCLE